MTDLNLLLQLCRRLLDTEAVPATWHPGHAGTRVLRATTADHGEVIVKLHRSPQRHKQEVHAYRTWVPALGNQAPELLADTDNPPTIIITAVPGIPLNERQLSPEAEQDAYRQAGQLLRALHAAGPPRREPDWTAWLAERAEYWIHRAADNISADFRAEVRAHMRALQDLAPLPAVPCHLDFMPRNMIYGHDGIVRLIDFEHSRYDLAARDLVRLATRAWTNNAVLPECFNAGYGPLRAVDFEVISHCSLLDQLTTSASAPAVTARLPTDLQQPADGAASAHSSTGPNNPAGGATTGPGPQENGRNPGAGSGSSSVGCHGPHVHAARSLPAGTIILDGTLPVEQLAARVTGSARG